MKRRSDLRRAFPVTEREREISGRRVMTGGAHMAVREGRGELGWVGSGQSGPAGFPGAAQVGSWPLFFLLSFSFVMISVLSF
jgi:hypothetical protein